MSEQQSDLERLKAEVAELEAQVKEQRDRMPAHSIRPHQLMELEELEEELAEKKRELKALEGG